MRVPAGRDVVRQSGGVHERSLTDRLRDCGVDDRLDPVEAWRALYRREGRLATAIDLYELVAASRGIRPEQLPKADRLTLARIVQAETIPGFAITEDSSRAPDPIELVDYDPDWPDRYTDWERDIRTALGLVAHRIEHVGSTSVPGLAAKPVIDVQISVEDLAAEERYVPQLEDLGLRLRSRDDEHRFFRPADGAPRDVHVHVCEAGSTWEHDHLLFRDHLRTHPDACAAYLTAKQAAAARWTDDRLAYTDAKTGIVLQILAEAAR